MTAIFVTATGTGIGKTYVTAGLARHLAEQGKSVGVLKPVVTGFMPDHNGSDPAVLLKALGEPASVDAMAAIAPWRFALPLSPDMAAAREGREIDFDELLAFCRAAVARHDTLLIEGIGGVMVPLDARHTVLDWMAALDLPVILVTGSYLGTLSHTLTAAAALERASVRLACLVMNDSGDGQVPLTDTAATLRRFLPGLEIAIVPRNASSLDFAPLAALVFRDHGLSDGDKFC